MTTSMAPIAPGEIVWLALRYGNRSGLKERPCVVLSTQTHNYKRREIVVMGLSSKVERLRWNECLLNDFVSAGLDMPSSLVMG